MRPVSTSPPASRLGDGLGPRSHHGPQRAQSARLQQEEEEEIAHPAPGILQVSTGQL